MNPFLLGQCQKLMNKLYNKPTANMLKENWTDLSGKLTLNIINDKLNSNSYASLFDFFLDIRLLLEQRDPQNPENAITNVILEDLTQWITYKFHNMPRTQEELDYFEAHKLAQKVNLIFAAMNFENNTASLNDSPFIGSSSNQSPNLVSPSSSFNSLSSTDNIGGIYSTTTSSAYSPINGFSNYGSYQLMSAPKQPQAGQKRLEILQQRIEHLRTPQELQAVLKILQKHIPQFTLAPEVVIEGRYITKACAIDLKEYLNSVNA